MDHSTLKTRQRAIRETFPPSLGLRVHRALSWLGRAEREAEDFDARFIFLWIAFNAAYANELPDLARFSEQGVFANFVKRIVALDEKHILSGVIWSQFPSSIRLLIDNRYIFQPFWDFHNGRDGAEGWEKRFRAERAAAHRALGRRNTARVLLILLDRLYTLRNQLVHGGATWGSSVNRDQVRDAANIMGHVVPAVIDVMMSAANEVWGEPCYPVVD